MGQQVNYPAPRLPVQARTTFGVYVPTATHTRPASCAEVGCAQHERGWTTTVLEGSADEALLRQTASGAVDRFGRRRYYPPVRVELHYMRYVFPPGQPCFAASRHRVPLERPALHVIRGGDHRGVVGEPEYMRGGEWVDRFATHQDHLSRAINGPAQ